MRPRLTTTSPYQTPSNGAVRAGTGADAGNPDLPCGAESNVPPPRDDPLVPSDQHDPSDGVVHAVRGAVVDVVFAGSGVLGTVLIIVVVLMLLGRI